MKKLLVISILFLAAGCGSRGAVTPQSQVTTPGASPTPVTQTATLIAVGDIMLSRSVGAEIKQDGVDFPFALINSYLHQGNIVFANLENPITTGPEVKPGDMLFHANPGVEKGLADAGISIVSLANNHVPNFGDQGVLDTVKYLDTAGIKHAGAGKDLNAASQPAYIENNGIKFAFLAFNDTDVIPKSYCATSSHPGTNCFNYDLLKSKITEAKANADIVIVSMHSGIEYSTPDSSQKSFAHAAIDDGADMVIGHHPHVVQSMEQYKGKYIFYSLGNFVFDQSFSRETMEGMTLQAVFSKTGVKQITFNPISINNNYQPQLIKDENEAGAVLKKLEGSK